MAALKPSEAIGKANRGFTLIELMIALLIGIFVIGMALTVMDMSVSSYRTQERVADIQQDVRAALEIMARDIRMAGFDPMRGSGATFLRAEKNVLAFQMDNSMSNTVATDEGVEEIIAYSYDAVDHEISRESNFTLVEGVDPGGQPLISNVSKLEFAYFNETGDALDPDKDIEADIRRVRISVTCEERDAAGKPFSRTLTTDVSVRNRIILPVKAIM